jgi:hypothetical protein
MTTEKKEQHCILVKKYKIHFDGSASKHKWPPSQDQRFGNIPTLVGTSSRSMGL